MTRSTTSDAIRDHPRSTSNCVLRTRRETLCMSAQAALTLPESSPQHPNATSGRFLTLVPDAKQQRRRAFYRKHTFTPSDLKAEKDAIDGLCGQKTVLSILCRGWYHEMAVYAAQNMTAFIPDDLALRLLTREQAAQDNPELVGLIRKGLGRDKVREMRNILRACPFIKRSKQWASQGPDQKPKRVLGLWLTTVELRCDPNGEPGAWGRWQEKRRQGQRQSERRLRAERRAETLAAKGQKIPKNQAFSQEAPPTEAPQSADTGKVEKTQTQNKDYTSLVVQEAAPDEAAKREAAEARAACREQFPEEAADAAGWDTDFENLGEDPEDSPEPEPSADPFAEARAQAARELAKSEAALAEEQADSASADGARMGILDIVRKPLRAQSLKAYAHWGQKLEGHIETLMRTGYDKVIFDGAYERLDALNALFDAAYGPKARPADLKRLRLKYRFLGKLNVTTAFALQAPLGFWLYEAKRMAVDGGAKHATPAAVLYLRVKARKEAL